MTSSPNHPADGNSSVPARDNKNPYRSPAAIGESDGSDLSDLGQGRVFRFGGPGVLAAALVVGAVVGVVVGVAIAFVLVTAGVAGCILRRSQRDLPLEGYQRWAIGLGHQ